MEVKTILLIAVILILLIVVLRYAWSGPTQITSLTSASTVQNIPSSQLSASTVGPVNYSYSIWFYVNDWNVNFGAEKVLFERLSSNYGGVNNTFPCPKVTLGASQNNLEISIGCTNGDYSGSPTAGTPTLCSDDSTKDCSRSQYIVHKCSVWNVPIQRWVHLIVSCYGRTVDVYIDGKLTRTCVLPGQALVDANAGAMITPDGGFSGYTSNFMYWSTPCDPQTAWNLYRQGYNGSMLGSFTQYGLRLSLLKGSQEAGSVTI